MHRINTNNKSGLAAVEMALLLPIFLILMVGVMDMARLFWTKHVVRDAAFEGARMAILEETTTNQIEQIIAKELEAGGVTLQSSVYIGQREPSQPVDVTVSVPFEFIVLGNMVPTLSTSRTIAATAVMTHER